ncbi:MAG TPA: hypothetical protein VNY84_06885, partial [Acidimicrobiales bacterium]|nr:hypothetical protein [Acidimicrobiales bacterium]
VPLRILGLGLQPTDQIQADVFLLTDKHPTMHFPEVGVEVRSSDAATTSLLNDLRADKNMDWVPQQAWLTFISIDGQTRQIKSDLSVDPQSKPRPTPPVTAAPTTTTSTSTTTTSTIPPNLVADPSPLTPLRAAHHGSSAWILVLVATLLIGGVTASASRLARSRRRAQS